MALEFEDFVNNLTEETTPDNAADFLVIVDTSGSDVNKVKPSNLLGTDLTAIKALSPSNDDILQRKAGAWTNRTVAQVKTDLGLWSDGFGIMGGAAYARYNTLYQNVLETGQENVDVRVDRVWQTNTGLALRYVNAQNFLLIQGFQGQVNIINVVGGVYSGQAVSIGQGYTTLRAVLNGSTVTVHADGANLGSFAVPSAINGTKHGLAYAGSKSFYDNFTIYGVQ